MERVLGLTFVDDLVVAADKAEEEFRVAPVFTGFAGVATVTLRMTGLAWKFPNMITVQLRWRRWYRACEEEERGEGDRA